MVDLLMNHQAIESKQRQEKYMTNIKAIPKFEEEIQW